jgi:G8 domain
VPPARNLPTGPYIQSGYSERITLPQPPEPSDLMTTRIACPHLEPNLKDWHATSTWSSGTIPKDGQDIMLPLNTKVVVLKSVLEKLGLITIPTTSALIIGEAANGIELHVKGMDVQGSLLAGSPTCRIQTPITITLYGTRPTDAVLNQPVPTLKGISVTGTLSLHGKRYFRTWTRLAQTAKPGDRVLLLQDAVNWEPNQSLVLVTTAMKDSRDWHRNEVLTVSVVDAPFPVPTVGAAVYLTSPVQYRHLANNGYQAEVGLLSRTILIQGSAGDSEPTDTSGPINCTVPAGEERYGDKSMPCGYTRITGYGGHVMVHQTGQGFVQGVEFYRMGQTNVLGRYPMHFHLLGNCPQCYVRDSSFHRSFYRCISIHGTNQATVSENVAYDVTGYCYYLEDGVEENNTLSYNLAAHIHAIGPKPPNGGGSQSISPTGQGPQLTLPADITASGFYITNVRNNLIGNAASGVRLCVRGV